MIMIMEYYKDLLIMDKNYFHLLEIISYQIFKENFETYKNQKDLLHKSI